VSQRRGRCRRRGPRLGPARAIGRETGVTLPYFSQKSRVGRCSQVSIRAEVLLALLALVALPTLSGASLPIGSPFGTPASTGKMELTNSGTDAATALALADLNAGGQQLIPGTQATILCCNCGAPMVLPPPQPSISPVRGMQSNVSRYFSCALSYHVL